ncbi:MULTISPECIES: hypothetical protein [Planktothrix]|uniref:Uncharacterized protein n=1 Tax=Planktothrix agardhii TaxID=1160 RepID=A0AAD1Q427_PLAAG|nr:MULTISPECIES: hypothetical protein [Planktothrix]MDS1345235.1 hypothetical protein [Planktothrix agardhii NRERC-751]MEA5563149.1 hypothetical protein [Planktothrix agardhii UHCC 0887]CAD5953057.1 hypothetical protein PANO66_02748 [Planktothrix agardhii]
MNGVKRDFRGEIVTVAVRNTKGMSVSLAIESLPPFRRPAKFGGTGKDPIWQIDDRIRYFILSNSVNFNQY